VFHRHQRFPPAVARAAEFLPLADDELVHGVLEQGGQVGRGGELRPLGVVAAREFRVAGHQGIKLADAAQARGLQFFHPLRAYRAQQVVQGGAELVFRGGHFTDASRALDHRAAAQVADQLPCFTDGCLQSLHFKDAAAKTAAQACLECVGQVCRGQGGIEQALAHALACLRGGAERVDGGRGRERGRPFLAQTCLLYLFFFHKNLLLDRFGLIFGLWQKPTPAGGSDHQVDGIDFFNARDLAPQCAEDQVGGETHARASTPVFLGGGQVAQHLSRRTAGTHAQADALQCFIPARMRTGSGQVAHRTRRPGVIYETLHPLPQRQ